MKKLFFALTFCYALTFSAGNAQHLVFNPRSPAVSSPQQKTTADLQTDSDSLQMNVANVSAVYTTPGLDLRQTLPPSPTATQMLRFIDYPISHYTGTVDISIPIYTIEINGISVPISLRYHASGIRYDDVSTGVGLGWMLDAGGVVTYDAKGMDKWESEYKSDVVFAKNKDNLVFPDDRNDTHDKDDLDELLELTKKPIHAQTTGNYPEDNYYLLSSGAPVKDGEVDIISYSLPGHSGKIGYRADKDFFNFNDDPVTFSATKNFADITDEDGIKYRFVPTYSTDATSIWPRSTEGVYIYSLKEIKSADGTDTIRFTYDTSGSIKISKPVINDTRVKTTLYAIDPEQGINLTPPAYQNSSVYKEDYYPDILRSITYRGGSIEFSWSGDDNSTSTPLYLNRITIKSNGNVIKVVNLLQGTFSNGQQRLDKIEFKDAGNVLDYDYKFAYNDIPSNHKDIMQFRMGVDYWGYYNGKANSVSYVPNLVNSSYIYGLPASMDRSPNITYMIYGTLNKMTHPTGGYSTYTYEAHRAGLKTWGGLRIKKIENHGFDGVLLYRNRYEYGGTTGEGTAVDLYPSAQNFKTDNYHIYCARHNVNGWDELAVYTYQYEIYGSFPKSLSSYFGSPVVYPHVTEYREGSVDGENGKTEYYYSYTSPDLYNMTNRSTYAAKASRSYNHKNGKLISKQLIDSSGKTVYSLENTYTEYNKREVLNLHAEKLVTFGNLVDYQRDKYRELYIPANNPSNNFDTRNFVEYYNYYSVCGRYVLTSTLERWDGGKNMTTTYSYPSYPSNYTYPQSHYETNIVKVVPFPAEKRVTYPDGSVERTTYKYPYNYTTSPYNTMTNNNVLSPVIEETGFDGAGVQLSRLLTNYSVVRPSSIQTMSRNSSTMEPRVVYKKRDRYGNPQHIVEDGINVVYIWSDNYRYPVIEVRGASDAQVAAIFTDSAAISLGSNTTSPGGTAITNYASTLRSRLTTALVSAYNYEPGVGMIWAIDPSGRKTTYTYDSQNRLASVIDPAGNIVEKYQYGYKK